VPQAAISPYFVHVSDAAACRLRPRLFRLSGGRPARRPVAVEPLLLILTLLAK